MFQHLRKQGTKNVDQKECFDANHETNMNSLAT